MGPAPAGASPKALYLPGALPAEGAREAGPVRDQPAPGGYRGGREAVDSGRAPQNVRGFNPSF